MVKSSGEMSSATTVYHAKSSTTTAYHVSQPTSTVSAAEEPAASYPRPIVQDMLSAARVAKERLAAVRSSEFGKKEVFSGSYRSILRCLCVKQRALCPPPATFLYYVLSVSQACAVYQKHGSRKGKRESMNLGETTYRKKSNISNASMIVDQKDGQEKELARSVVKQTSSLLTFFDPRAALGQAETSDSTKKTTPGPMSLLEAQSKTSESQDIQDSAPLRHQRSHGSGISTYFQQGDDGSVLPPSLLSSCEDSYSWACHACTFENTKPEAPVCAVCGTSREAAFQVN